MNEFDTEGLATAFAVSSRTIRRWVTAGMPSHGDRTSRTFRLPECVAWRVAQDNAAGPVRPAGDADVPPRAESEARLAAAKASAQEMENHLRRGHLMPIARMEELLSRDLGAVNARLATAPQRHAKPFAERLGISQAEAVALIRDIVEAVRADIRAIFEGDGT